MYKVLVTPDDKNKGCLGISSWSGVPQLFEIFLFRLSDLPSSLEKFMIYVLLSVIYLTFSSLDLWNCKYAQNNAHTQDRTEAALLRSC